MKADFTAPPRRCLKTMSSKKAHRLPIRITRLAVVRAHSLKLNLFYRTNLQCAALKLLEESPDENDDGKSTYQFLIPNLI